MLRHVQHLKLQNQSAWIVRSHFNTQSALFGLILSSLKADSLESRTHIVLHQVRVVLLYSIIQDGHHHPFTCVAQLPSTFGIQVTVVSIVLMIERANTSEGISLRHLGADKNKSGRAL